MNSCLNPFWEEITPLIIKLLNEDVGHTEVGNQNSSRIVNAIDKLLNNSEEMNELEHLRIFQDGFRGDSINYDKISCAAKKAIEKCNECRKCWYCTNCSLNVYQKIIDRSLTVNTLPHDLSNYFSSKSQISFYKPFFSLQKNVTDISDSLFCLKGFSSSTPVFHSAVFSSQCSGGGFYINIHGIGIVIDPGVGFVNLMHNYGISINDVDIVIITHNHSDHCVDAPLLSSLNYDLNRYYSQNRKIFQVFNEPQLLPQHKIKWILDEDSKEMYKNIIKDCDCLSDYQNKEKSIGDVEEKILLSAIKTAHDNTISSYGIKIRSKYENHDFSIGYTSDTRFLETLPSFFDSVNILIFNISDIYKDDIKYYQPKFSHLGYSGSLKLINKIRSKPQLAIASEFCCTNGDFRTRIISKLFEETKANGFDGVIIPGEIGLKIQLPSMSCQCTICKRMIPIDKIIVTDPSFDYGALQYICERCTVKQLK